MTGQQLKEVMEYRGKMAQFLRSEALLDGADDWIRMELHNQKREIEGEVANDLRQERENARLGGRAYAQRNLRCRLKHLISIILAHSEPKVKERVEQWQ